MNEENEQNENESEQSETSAERANDAPGVATSGTPAEGEIKPGEVEDEQREHLERRSEAQLPDPNENVTQQGSDQPDQPSS